MPESSGTVAANIQDSASGNNLIVSASGAAKTDGSAVTQPISVASLPLPSGASTAAGQATLDTDLGVINANLTNGNLRGSIRMQDGSGTALTSTSINGRQALDTRRADVSLIAVTATGVSGAAVTCTLPAVASVFHYIQAIQITKYAVVALVGGATPTVVTTTNLPGNIAFTFATAQAIGTTIDEDLIGIDALRSSVVNTATTIVCPATANVIWRVNIFYYTTG